jgi:hypothetical protein
MFLQELPDAYHASHALPAMFQSKDGTCATVNAQSSGVMYSCQSCLHPLFHAGNIVLKAAGEGSAGGVFFIELIHWMHAQRVHR